MKRFFNFLNSLDGAILISLSFNLLLLLLRVIVTQSWFYSFLVWNLFLAAVPYGITRIMSHSPHVRQGRGLPFGVGFSCWLLFFPNSTYIITDLIHLRNGHSYLPWYDLFLVFVFAFNGLFLGMLSLFAIQRQLGAKFSKRTTLAIVCGCCFLAGYGIYLGRFLRFNSWDVLTKPRELILQIGYSTLDLRTWYTTLAFGVFLWIVFNLVRIVGSSPTARFSNNCG